MINTRSVIAVVCGDAQADHVWYTERELSPEEALGLLQQARDGALEQGDLGTPGLDFHFSLLYGPGGQRYAQAPFWYGDPRLAWMPDWQTVKLLVCVFAVNDIRIFISREQWEQQEDVQRCELQERRPGMV